MIYNEKNNRARYTILHTRRKIMAFCARCGNQIGEGQTCGCSGSGKSAATGIKPFRERVKAWPKTTKNLLKWNFILIVIFIALCAVIPVIAGSMANSQKDSLIKKTQDTYKQIIAAALDGKSFDSMKLSCTGEEDYLNNIKYSYDQLASTLQKQENGAGYKSLKVTGFSNISTPEKLDDGRPFSCDMRAQYDYVLTSFDWQTGNLSDESLSSEVSVSLTYTYENGKWVLQRINLGSFGNSWGW